MDVRGAGFNFLRFVCGQKWLGGLFFTLIFLFGLSACELQTNFGGLPDKNLNCDSKTDASCVADTSDPPDETDSSGEGGDGDDKVDPPPPPPAAACGDGHVDAGEQCDDGNQVDTDACTRTCKKAVCGDRIVQAGVETCDGTAGCSPTCQYCPKGFIPRRDPYLSLVDFVRVPYGDRHDWCAQIISGRGSLNFQLADRTAGLGCTFRTCIFKPGSVTPASCTEDSGAGFRFWRPVNEGTWRIRVEGVSGCGAVPIYALAVVEGE